MSCIAKAERDKPVSPFFPVEVPAKQCLPVGKWVWLTEEMAEPK
jgi:hypothetical protein